MPHAPELGRLGDYVAHWAVNAPYREAVVLDELRLNYAALPAAIESCAAALLAAGVERGDRVAYLGHPRPEFFVAFLAASEIGAVFHGLNPKHQPNELQVAVADSEPTALLTAASAEPSVHALAETVRAQSSSIQRIIRWSPSHSAHRLSERARPRDCDPRLTHVRDGADAPVAVVYTSGSTGQPKGALLSQRGVIASAYGIAKHWTPEEGARILCDLPIDHVAALVEIGCTSLVSGGTIVFQERFDAAGVLRVIERERVNAWGVVPTMLLLVTQRADWRRADLSSVRHLLWSGGPAPSHLIEAVRRRVPRVSTCYGLTEASGAVTFTDDCADLETLSETVGRPRHEIRIVGPDDDEHPVGREGEILVRGPSLMIGYLNNAQATAEVITPGGWLRTGDLGYLRRDGNLVLTGRRKDLYKSGGQNVYPREVEECLERHERVQLAAVVAVRDDLYGEVGHAFIATGGEDLAAEELRAFARERLANFKVPKRFTVLERLPMLPLGKVDKAALRDGAMGTSPL